MKNRKPLTLLASIAAVLATAPPSLAASAAPPAPSRLLLGKRVNAAAEARRLKLFPEPARAEAAYVDTTDGPPKLEGTWQVTATFTKSLACEGVETACSPLDVPAPFKVLITFTAGRSVNEGTLFDTNEFQLTPNPVCAPDQGTWARTSYKTFRATHYAFCFDASMDFAPAGYVKVRDAISLDDVDTLSARQRIDGFSPDGTLNFIGEVTLAGTRVRAEAPPEPMP